MLTIKDELTNGVIVNVAQQRLMQDIFRINAWSYVHENPFELRDRLDEQEKRLKDVGVK